MTYGRRASTKTGVFRFVAGIDEIRLGWRRGRIRLLSFRVSLHILGRSHLIKQERKGP